MALQAVINAVEARLAANWTKSAIKAVNLDAEAPSDGSPFLIVQYPVANSHQQSLGAPGVNIWREEGLIRIVINTERGGGETKALQWADELGVLFRGQLFDGVQCWEVNSPHIDDTNDQGNYFMVSIMVRYWFDLIG